MNVYDRYIAAVYPSGTRPSFGVVATDFFMPILLMFVLLAIVIGMPWLIYASIQAQRATDVWTSQCEDAGYTAVVNYRSADLCIDSSGRIVEVRR